MKYLIIIIGLFVTIASSQAQEWVKVAQKDGGAVSQLTANKFGDFFCAAFNQVYRSVDQGNLWQKQTTPSDSVLSVQLFTSCDSNSQTAVFALASGMLLRSTDDGQRWYSMTALNDSIKTSSLTNLFSSRYGDLILAFRSGSSYKLMKSRDNGNTYEDLAMLDASPSAVYQAQDSTYYVYSSACFRINKDHSTTNVGAVSIQTSNQDFFNAPVNLWGVQNNLPVRSTNKGDLWKSMTFDFKESGSGSISKIILNRDGDAYLFWKTTSDSMRMYRLYSGTSSWTKIRDFAFSFRDVVVNSIGTMVASSALGIYISEDGGQTWINSSKGISTYPLMAATMSQGSICVAGYNGLISQTNTAGLSWSTANVPSSDPSTVVNDMLTTSRGHVIAASSRGLWVSSDFGLNYLAGQRASQAFNGESYSVTEVAPGVLYAVTKVGLLRSNDDGINWENVDTTSLAGSISSPANGRFVISGVNGVMSGDTSNSALMSVIPSLPLGCVALTRTNDVFHVSYVKSGSTYTVRLNRKKSGGSTEQITIPCSGTNNNVPVCVVAAKAADAYVNTDLGLYHIAASSTQAQRVVVENEVFSYLKSINATQAVGATLYGGVYIHDFNDDVESEVDAQRDIRVSPQPVRGSMLVQSSSTISEVVLRSLDGRELVRTRADVPTTELRLTTQDLSTGCYVIELHSTSQVRHKLVIVTNN